MSGVYKQFQMALFVAVMTPMGLFASGAVYAMTNQQGANQIEVWTRATNGQLTFLQTISTQGGGSGIQIDPTDSLGSQGGLVLNRTHTFLFAVNTETGTGTSDCNMGTITTFVVGTDGALTFASRVSSGGLYPDSLAVEGNLLYVLNAGGPGDLNACGMEPNITGFKVDLSGQLTQIPLSTYSINPGPMPGSTVNPAGFLNCDPGGFPSTAFCGLNPPAFPRSPAEIKFTPGGQFLAVTEKGTNSIYMFPLIAGILPNAPVIWKAPGPNQPTYFGFSFDVHGNLIVDEPFGTSPTIPAKPASAMSSFSIGSNGTLTPITSDLANNQSLACWVIFDPITGQYAFVGNNGSGTISSYMTDSNGNLTLLNATAGSGLTGPNDLAVARQGNHSYLYALGAGDGTLNGWTINSDGSLTSLGPPISGLPVDAGAQGLASY